MVVVNLSDSQESTRYVKTIQFWVFWVVTMQCDFNTYYPIENTENR